MQREKIRASSFDTLAVEIARRFREGRLSFRDIVGLSNAEMQALTAVAESFRSSGELEDAITVYSLLLALDPLSARLWRAMADLQARTGAHAMAVACFEAVALLGGREVDITRRQAVCLEQLGQHGLAREIRAIAAGEEREESVSGAPARCPRRDHVNHT
jgi:hypothetical protein